MFQVVYLSKAALFLNGTLKAPLQIDVLLSIHQRLASTHHPLCTPGMRPVLHTRVCSWPLWSGPHLFLCLIFFFLFFKFSRAEFVTDGATYTILILNHPQCVVENSWKTLTLADYYFSCTIQRGLLIFSCKSHLPWRFTIVPAALDGHSNGVEVAGTCVIFHNCLNLAPTVYFRLKLHLKLALHIDVLLYVCVEKALNFYFIRLVQHLPIKKD